jgi:type II secretory pathway pseudopilin PulG
MTLVEVMVAMAIIAIVATMCVSAFMMVIGSETRETNTRLASERAEERIATGAEPTTQAAVALSLGAFTIPAEVNTYSETVGTDAAIATENGQIDTSGSRSYSVLTGNDPPQQEPFALYFGKDAGYDLPTNHFEPDPEEAGGGGVMGWEAPVSGKYRLEVWGASGGEPQIIGTNNKILYQGKGGYSVGTVRLKKGDVLYLHAGGKGASSTQSSVERPGGYNGGGTANASDNGDRTGGGGASDICIVPKDDVAYTEANHKYYRVIVAGGGGGGSSYNTNPITADTGVGGGLTGGQGGYRTAGSNGTGGELSAGGSSVFSTGRFGEGGTLSRQSNTSNTVSGGGGGWYGGGSGNAAGGGSGWLFTKDKFDEWIRADAGTGSTERSSVADKDNFVLDDYKEPNGIDFTYALTDFATVRGDVIKGMPDPFDDDFDPKRPEETTINTMTGNAGPGFVRITYLAGRS